LAPHEPALEIAGHLVDVTKHIARRLFCLFFYLSIAADEGGHPLFSPSRPGGYHDQSGVSVIIARKQRTKL
jgi:hypothetical protein